jgi:hypothetical protein
MAIVNKYLDKPISLDYFNRIYYYHEDENKFDIDEVISFLERIKKIFKEHEHEFPYYYDYTIEGKTEIDVVPHFYLFTDEMIFGCDIYHGYDRCQIYRHFYKAFKMRLILKHIIEMPIIIFKAFTNMDIKQDKWDIRNMDVVQAKQAIKNQSFHYEDVRTRRSKYYFHLCFFIGLISSIGIMIGSIIQYEDFIISIKDIFVPIFILLLMVLVFEIDLLWKRRSQYLILKNSVQNNIPVQIVDNYGGYRPGPEDILIKIHKTTTYEYISEKLVHLIDSCYLVKNEGATHLCPERDY